MEKVCDIKSEKTASNSKKCIILSLAIGIVLTFAVYPGVLMTDSAARWALAEEIQNVFKTHGFQQLDCWLSATPSIFMSIILLISHNVALFTFLQIFLFYYSIFSIIYKVSESSVVRIIGILFFLCVPVFWGFSCYHEMSVWVVIGLNFSLLLLDYASSVFLNLSAGKKIAYYLLLYVSFYIGIGFRQNAITVVPVLVVVIIYFQKKDIKILIGELIVLGFSLLSIILVPSMIGIHVGNSGSAGFVWEMLCTIQTLPNEKQEGYINYLDYINGDGSTQQSLLENQTSDYLAGEWLFRGDCFPLLAIGKDDIQKDIYKSYLSLYIKEPQAMIKTKSNFILRMLGIGKPLNFQGYYENDVNDYSKFGLTANNKYRSILIRCVNQFMENDNIFTRPWLWFLVATVLFIRRKETVGYYSITLFLLSVFYMCAFFINTQGFLYRYFFPSNCFLALSILGMCGKIEVSPKNIEMLKLVKGRVFKPVVLYATTSVALLTVMGYIIWNSVWLDNYRNIQAAMTSGKQIFKDTDDIVLLQDNAVVFIHDKEGDSTGFYYLHIYPKNSAYLERQDQDFNTIDFYLLYKEIHTIGYRNKEIAFIELPEYELSKIVAGHTGSYDIKNNWESELFLN